MFKKNPTSVRLTLRALGYLLSYPDAQLRSVMPQLIDALQDSQDRHWTGAAKALCNKLDFQMRDLAAGAQKSNEALLRLIERHAGSFRVAYAITGVALEQMHSYAPEALESFQKLVDTVEAPLQNHALVHASPV